MRHFLEMDDVSEQELTQLLTLCDPTQARPLLAGKGVALIFEKPSNRTRNASEMAVVGLGGHPITIRGEEIGLGIRETVEDVTRVLGRYHALIGARVFDHRNLEGMAGVGCVPIVNLLSDVAHPTQIVADLLTLRQRWGHFDGKSIAWVGDGNNVARSLVIGCGMAGLEVRLACPPGHLVDPVAVDAARSRGVEVVEIDHPAEAVAGADAVYTDVWVSMGQEGEAQSRVDAFAGYAVTAQLMDKAAPGALFLHCLPAHRGLEVEAAVMDGPQSVVFDQAANRMHAARAVFHWLVESAG
jgi:ornithine carbamoyltransferase